MEELLKSLVGKTIDITCGTTGVFRGDVVKIVSGVLYLMDDEERTVYVAIDKIATLCECSEHSNRPGFVV
ncbi:MAG: MM0924 family protein [Pyrinomonadaceae bacterium]